MLIDTHAHLNFAAFKDDADKIIDQCLKNDLWIINVGSQYSTSKRAIEIAEKYPKGIYAAIGLHPIHAIPNKVDVSEVSPSFKSKPEKFNADKYRKLAKSKKVIAVGEVGLDYSYAKNDKNKEIQKKVFIEQLSLAKELNLPVIIHCRDAWKDLIEILRNFQAQHLVAGSWQLAGVAHFFSGSIEDAKELISMGFLVSFTGVITFTKAYDATIEEIPMEKLMIETDCPYVSPVPFRGKRNIPLYVKYVAKRISEIKEVSENKVADTTTQNAKNLFKI